MTSEFDPHLKEALRHAPGHDEAPPAAVRETILRAARDAVRPVQDQPPTPTPTRAAWWRGLADAWLRPARLGYSGAFVVLLVLGVWGLDRIDDEARKAPEHGEPTVADASKAAAPAQTQTQAQAPAPEPTAAPAQVANGTAPAAADIPTSRRRSRAPATAATAREEAARPELAEAMQQPAPAPVPARAPAPAQSPAPAQAAPPAPMGNLATASPPAAAPAADRVAQSEAAQTSSDRATAQPGAATSAGAVAKSAAPALARAPAARFSAAESAADPLADLTQQAAAQPGWRWKAGAFAGPHGPAQAAWLEALRSATAGRWQRADAMPDGAQTLQLADGAGMTTDIALTSEPAAWLRIGRSVLRAPLSEAAIEKLEALRAKW
jgi:hypothetical protein